MEELMKVELAYQEQYSFGMYHSGLPLFHHIYLKNTSKNHLKNLKVSVQTTPNILLKGESVVDFLLSGGHRFLSCDFIHLDVSYLAELDTVQDVRISLLLSDENNAVLQVAEFSVNLLPYFFFSGLTRSPETLSFFVTPSQKELNTVMATDSFSDPFDYCQQLYDRLKEQKITFSSSDYADHTSKRIRLPEQVLRERFGNGLEICLLFASCCERVGLKAILAFTGKGRVYAGFSLRNEKMKLLTTFEKGQKNFDELYLIDGSVLSYGSELDFDHALYQSKNTLNLDDEHVTVLSIQRARELGLRALPDRFFDGSAWVLTSPEPESSARFTDYYDLVNTISDDERIAAILSGDPISVSGNKNSVPFQTDLDVNQNKVLSKILSNNITVIRAQMGAGATTVLAHAASRALLAGKRVLYIKDHSYHSDDFTEISSAFFNNAFIFDASDEQNPKKKADFTGIFREHSSVFEDRQVAQDALQEIDTYYAHLEGDRTIVSSFLVAADRYHQLQDANEGVVFSPEQVGALTDDMVQTWFTTVNDLVNAYAEIGNAADHPLLLVRQKHFSYEYKSKLIGQLEETLHSIEAVMQLRDQLSSFFPSLNGIHSPGIFFAFLELIRLFGEFEVVPDSFFASPDKIEENFRTVTQLIRAKKDNDSITESILISFTPDVLELDAADLFLRYQAAINDKSFKGISQKHSIIKSIKRFLKPNCDVENVEHILFRLHDLAKNQAFIDQEKESVFRLFSISLRSCEADWAALQQAADLCYQCYSVFLTSLSPEQLPSFVNDYRQIRENDGVMQKLSSLREVGENFALAKDALECTVSNQLDFFYPWQSTRDDDYFSYLYESLSSVLSAADHLKNWCNWLSVKDSAVRLGLKNMVSAIENGKLLPGECKRSFLRAFFKAVCEYNFIAHADLIPDAFKFDASASAFRGAQRRISEKRSSELDSILSLRRLDALSMISQDEFFPIELFKSDRNSFFNIYPCVVCDVKEALELFKRNHNLFDYVLIECRSELSLADFSQICYLGKKVAFAGTFSFTGQRQDVSFDLATPAFDYLWKHIDEKYSLTAIYDSTPSIAVCKKDYGQALRSDCHSYTVPAPFAEISAEWITVPGCFNTEYPMANLAEAELCVEKLVQFAIKEDRKSIGIVALTDQQKKLILRLLSQKLRIQSELTQYFSNIDRFSVSTASDPIVKRDVLLLSTVFAPNRSIPGSPLPHSILEFGGIDPYKLVFQLLSSAKEHFTVVSSFDESVFKFTPSVLPSLSSLNLLYKIVMAQGENSSYSLTGLFDHFSVVRSLAFDLEKRGFRVQCGVQSGRYYIDLAVLDQEDRFVLGILSDQTVMNQKANISAIELANADFYERFGWKLYRLSSARCFDAYENELESILSILSPRPKVDFI